MGDIVYAGIDIGSLSSEAVLLGEDGILGYSIMKTGSNPRRTAQQCLKETLERNMLREKDIRMMVATGYGRISVPFADREITEITCHARGAHHLCPGTRTVIDIGGQDSKIITIDKRGNVTDFAMNDKCAAGTGRFLEVMASALEMDLEEMGLKSMEAKRATPISSMCTVFAESEVISRVAEGHRPEEIIRGLHEAIARRVFGLARRLKVREEVTFSGGVAKNPGIVASLKRLIGMPVNVPDEPQIIGALGAALYARDLSFKEKRLRKGR